MASGVTSIGFSLAHQFGRHSQQSLQIQLSPFDLFAQVVQIFPILKHASHRLHDGLVVQPLSVESDESRRPIQSFGYSGSFVKIHLAHPLHKSAVSTASLSPCSTSSSLIRSICFG